MLVVGANCLIGFVTYEYLTVLAPNYLVPFLGKAGAAAVVCAGLFLLFNILFNYWACVLTRPGFPGHHPSLVPYGSRQQQPHLPHAVPHNSRSLPIHPSS